eukprot:2784717-Pleurochrysis_carterae.AAC.2
MPLLRSRRMCTWRALAICALSFQSPSAWPTSPSSLRPDRRPPQARPAPASVLAPAPCTPASGVSGSKESVPAIDSNRARPLSGCFVNHQLSRWGGGAAAAMVTGESSNYQSPTLATFFRHLTVASGYTRLEETLTQQLYHSQLAQFLFSPTTASPPFTADATGHADWLDAFNRVITAIRVAGGIGGRGF